MDNNSSKATSAKPERKIIEKNRRSQMKNLYSQLFSLLPRDASLSMDHLTLPDKIDHTINYIKSLQDNVETLKRMRDSFRGDGGSQCNTSGSKMGYSLKSPVQIEVREKAGDLEVIVVTGLECQFVFTEAIRVLDEEQVHDINASYSVLENTVFHTIHAKIGDAATSHEVARIAERLKKFCL